jgi:hypothetical protein
VLIDDQSVSKTVDAISAALFDDEKLSLTERQRTARWLAARQGLPGAYGGTFAGFEREFERGILLFTGERIASASARHILGEEACRALRLLRVSEPKIDGALQRASEGVHGFLARAAKDATDPKRKNPGYYCCGKCSVGLWRHVLAGGLDRQEERLTQGIRRLRSLRDGAHEWHRFPFWYTVLALTEADVPEAKRELQYATPLLLRAAQRKPGGTIFGQRRQRLATRALARL